MTTGTVLEQWWAALWDEPLTIFGTACVFVAAVMQTVYDMSPATVLTWAIADVDPVAAKAAVQKQRLWNFRYDPDEVLWLPAQQRELLRGSLSYRTWAWILLSVGSGMAFVGTLLDTAWERQQLTNGSVYGVMATMVLVTVLVVIAARRAFATAQIQLVRRRCKEWSGITAPRLQPSRRWRHLCGEAVRARRVLEGSRRSHASRVLRHLGVQTHLRWHRCVVAGLIAVGALTAWSILPRALPHPFRGIAELVGWTCALLMVIIVARYCTGALRVVISTANGVSVRLMPGGGILAFRRHRVAEIHSLVREHRTTANGAPDLFAQAAERDDVLILLTIVLQWADDSGVTLLIRGATTRLDTAYQLIGFTHGQTRQVRPRRLTVWGDWFTERAAPAPPYRVRVPLAGDDAPTQRAAGIHAAAIALGYRVPATAPTRPKSWLRILRRTR